MRCKKPLGFNDKKLVFFGIPLLGLVIPLVFFGQTGENGVAQFLGEWLCSSVFVSIIWMSSRKIWHAIQRKFPNDEQKRLTMTVPILLVFGLIAAPILHEIFNLFGPFRILEHPLLQGIYATIFSLTAVVSIYEALYYFHRFRMAELENEQLRRATTEARLDGLRSQVNPHFLFNSLNTLAALIPENAEKAVFFVEKLAKVYRYSLDLPDEPLVSLAEELGFLDSYIFLLKERFGENLRVKMDLPDRFLNHQLPPLTLQILLENAIKHNIISQARPLEIYFSLQKNSCIVVRNNLQPKSKIASDSPGRGLENVRARYAFFTEKTVEVSPTDSEFVIIVPLISPILNA
jgi:two-component system, LytTR family, sensor kinase